ncbi:MAG TPA: hypothetical protein VIW26_02165 [Gemmatimonadales bacterium]|jgi:hypothetical protein
MTTFPNSPRVLKGGLVLLDADSAAVLRVIALQYNPDTLSRSFAIQALGETGDRSEVFRIKAPPVETIKLDAHIDATDQLEFPDKNPMTLDSGIQSQLAALEMILYPSSAQLQANQALAQSGVLEILPVEAPLLLFVWSRYRIVPVRLTELSITEEMFDPRLNPIRAKVSLGLRVLSINDVAFGSKAGSLYMLYQQQKERFAAKARDAAFGALGIGGIP